MEDQHVNIGLNKIENKIKINFIVNSDRTECQNGENVNYVFVSNSNTINNDVPYLCKDHKNNLDNKDLNCILPIADAITFCNSDNQCQGFMINTDENWQKMYSKNGMQSVKLFGQGAISTPNEMWRTFKKQH